MPTVSLTVTTDQASRISRALGVAQGLGRDATLGEVKVYLIDTLRVLVKSVEEQIAIQQIPPVPDLGTLS